MIGLWDCALAIGRCDHFFHNVMRYTFKVIGTKTLGRMLNGDTAVAITAFSLANLVPAMQRSTT